MRKHGSWVLKIAFFCIAWLYAGALCKSQTKGFTTLSIDQQLVEDLQFETSPISYREKEQLKRAFTRPFHFLGKGGQSYVFESEDKKIVLKFFKKKHLFSDPFVETLDGLLPLFLKSYRFKLFKTRQESFGAVFKSCQLAYERLKEETGIVYVHLHPTQEIWHRVEIIDTLGISHWIDLDCTSFVVQKKAELVFDRIQRQFNEGNIEGVHNSITALFKAICARSSMGIRDCDNGLKRNYGYIGKLAVCIDVGSLNWDESLKESSNAKKELARKTKKLRRWLAEFHKDLIPYYDEQFKIVFKQSNESVSS